MLSGRSLYRTNSAGGGINRLGSAASGSSRPSSGKRAGAETAENRALREQVSCLQHELLLTKSEAKKATDQLSCLVDLIKRAWTGDKTANVHVANIVGLAPPDFIETHNGVDSVTLVTKPKSRAVNHWAVLTIGLLNREYRRMEKELEAKQLCYFQRRQLYLEEQLLINRDQMLRLTQQSTSNAHHPQNGLLQQAFIDTSRQPPPGQRTAPREQHCPSPVEGLSVQSEPLQSHHYGWQQVSIPNRININKPPSAGPQRKATSAGKYRKPKESDPEVDLTWADLVIEPLQGQKINKTTNQAMDGLYRLPAQQNNNTEKNTHRGHGEEFDEDRIHMTYDDPYRYAQNGLFNVAQAVGTEAVTRNKRPLSGQMRKADSIRARPRSAVSVKQERPLKFETTRPVSAPKSSPKESSHPSNSSRQSHSNHNKKSAKEKKPTENMTASDRNQLRPATFLTTPDNNKGATNNEGKPGNINSNKPDLSELAEELRLRKAKLLQDDPELAELINVDVTQPECIKEFNDEILEMHNKELDFKKRAVELQKKLGISSGGMLYPDH